jgi:hypothetical protein
MISSTTTTTTTTTHNKHHDSTSIPTSADTISHIDDVPTSSTASTVDKDAATAIM